MSKRLTKADIVNNLRLKLRTVEVAVPQWADGDGEAPTVRLREWSIRDRDTIIRAIADIANGQIVSDLAAQIVAVSIVDDDGQLMFGSEEGVDELCELAPEGLHTIKNEALHLNGLGALANDEKGDEVRAEAKAKAAADANKGTAEEAEEDPKN